MRIIAGDAKGRKLYGPSGWDTRPTLDRVKESLFNILMSSVPDSRVLDLFAGTGNLGLEALSRGAARCVFVDSSRDSIRIVHKNIDMLGYGERAEVYMGDALSALQLIDRKKQSFDIIFVDPPYHRDIIPGCLQYIDSMGLLDREGIIAAEHDIKDQLPERSGALAVYRRRIYGDTSVSFYTAM